MHTIKNIISSSLQGRLPSSLDSTDRLMVIDRDVVVEMLLTQFCLFLALSNIYSPTSAILNPGRLVIREEDNSEESVGGEDPYLFYISLLPAANDPESFHDILDTTNSVADHYDFNRYSADDREVTLSSPPSSLLPQSEDLLAFHDGDFPPEGWGDCEFPKMPACCWHGWMDIFCTWWQGSSYVCPEHPEDYVKPRGPKEQAKYRAVCCDQVKDGVGVGCVPVTGRDEQEGYDVEDPRADDRLDLIFLLGGLRDINNLQFDPVPDKCKSAYRRDEEFDAFCPLSE